MMNFKSLGLGAYYRVRRISKAFKNWKKFGVVIFGSIFALSNVANLPAMAELDLVVGISPTRATISVGESQQYIAQVKEGTTNVTSLSNVSWTVKRNGTTVQTGTGGSINLAPTTVGLYNVTASATYNGRTARLLMPATLAVEASTDNRACVLTISPTGTSTIKVGESSPTYTAKVMHGTEDITNTANVQWTVTRNGIAMTSFSGTGKTFSFRPTSNGSYQLTARTQCGDKVAYSNVVSLTVGDPIQPPLEKDLVVGISPTRATIKLGGSQIYTAQVHEGTTNVTAQSTYNWTVKKGSTVVQTGQGATINVSPDAIGLYDITVAAVYQGRNARLLMPATLVVEANDQNLVCVLTVTPTGTKTITLGENSPTWTAKLTQNGQDITSSSTIQWSVIKNGVTQPQFVGTGSTFSFKPTQTGTYTIHARSNCGNTTVYAEAVILNVNTPPTVCVAYAFNPTSANLSLVNGTATQTFSVSARDQQGNNITLTNVNFQLTGNGTFATTSNTSGVFTATQAGSSTLKVTTTECGTVTAPIIVNAPQDRILFRVDVKPDHAGPVTCPSTVTFTVRGYDQFGQFIDPATEPITFTWNLNNPNLGTLNRTTGDSVQFTCNRGVTGTYFNFITATGHYKNMTASDSSSITLEDLIISDTLKCPVSVTVARNSIFTNDSTSITAQAFTTTGAVASGATFNWQVTNGNGSLSSNSGSTVTFTSGSMVGAAVIRLITSYAGTQCTQDVIVNVNNNNQLRVEITPDPAYAQPNTDVTFTARAWDENNMEVTSSTTFDWSMLNSAAGVITSEFGNQAIVRTGANFGTFNNAIQVTGFRNNRSASDTATIIIQQGNNFVIDGSLVGSVATNNNGVCTDDVITYRLTVNNNQPNTLNNVSAVVTLPAHTKFLSATSVAGSPSLQGNQVVWQIGTLGFGQSRVLEVRVIPTGKLKGNQRFVATANVRANEVPNGVNFTSNAIDLNCGAVQQPDGKGPLASTGIDWKALGLISLAALIFASGTYAVIRRKEQRF